MSAITLREAKPTDVVKFSKIVSPRFFYGIVAECDGRLVGMGVIVWGLMNRPYVCLNAEDELRARPLLMHRIGKMLTETGRKVCGRIYTIEDATEPKAAEWLKRLGYADTGEVLNGGRVLVYGDPA